MLRPPVGCTIGTKPQIADGWAAFRINHDWLNGRNGEALPTSGIWAVCGLSAFKKARGQSRHCPID